MRNQREFLRTAAVACLLLAVTAAGCNTASRTWRAEGLSADGMGTVAIIPFENLAGYPNAGHVMADLLEAELLARGAPDLMPGTEVREALAEHEGTVLSPEALGRVLGVDAVIVGRVTEYKYKVSLGEEPAVGVSVRLIDTATGEVLWSAARSQLGRFAWVREDSLSRLSQEVAARLAGSLLAGG
jgi:TolB-like protein